MKKFAMIALCVAAANVFAWEANVKTGFDFYRGTQDQTTKDHTKDEMGWTLGAEFIPFNKGVVELGVGFENNFGVRTVRFADGKADDDKKADIYVPVYALGKLNLVRSEDNNSSLYLLGRLGYAFSNELNAENGAKVRQGGLYYGAGVGVELGHFTVEGLYDGGYRKVENDKEFVHKAGLRVGFRFGDYLKEMPVEEVVEVKPVVIEVKPVVQKPKKVETKGLIHASCDEDAKKCIIHGFAVDGREPNAEEQKNIQEIANLINEFVKSADVSVIGHTDSTGSVQYNQKLSVARATSVNKLLREAGLKEAITVSSVSGKNESEPMATNKTKAGRYLNRRVEILFNQLNR